MKSEVSPSFVHVPPVSIPLLFILTGLAFLCVGLLWVVREPLLLTVFHHNPRTTALTHVFILGWLLSVVSGSLYQLAPVTLGLSLIQPRLCYWHWFMHTLGTVGMILAFLSGNMTHLGHFGSFVFFGVLVMVIHLMMMIVRSPQRDLIAWGMAGALGWLTLTVLAGLVLAADKHWHFSPLAPLAQMHAHAHMGLAGFFITLIMAVSFKLVPMFLISHVRRPALAGLSLILFNAGLVLCVFTISLQSPLRPMAVLIMLAGLICYALEMLSIVMIRQRASMDAGLSSFLLSVAGLIPVGILGLFLSLPTLSGASFASPLENSYALLAILGVISTAILGMLYKIVPFLTWHHCYSRLVGYQPVPSMGDLYCAQTQKVGFGIMAAGLLLLISGTLTNSLMLVRLGAILWLLFMLSYLGNLSLILSHFSSSKRSQP